MRAHGKLYKRESADGTVSRLTSSPPSQLPTPDQNVRGATVPSSDNTMRRSQYPDRIGVGNQHDALDRIMLALALDDPDRCQTPPSSRRWCRGCDAQHIALLYRRFVPPQQGTLGLHRAAGRLRLRRSGTPISRTRWQISVRGWSTRR